MSASFSRTAARRTRKTLNNLPTGSLGHSPMTVPALHTKYPRPALETECRYAGHCDEEEAT